jgi:hypothetical protein
MDLKSSIIKTNPLKELGINSLPDRPKWMCIHSDAKVTDYEKHRYNCLKCNPKGGGVNKYFQPAIVDIIHKNQPGQNA